MTHWTAGFAETLQPSAHQTRRLFDDDFKNFKVGSATGLLTGAALSLALIASATASPSNVPPAAVAALLASVGTFAGGGIGVAIGLAATSLSDRIIDFGARLTRHRASAAPAPSDNRANKPSA